MEKQTFLKVTKEPLDAKSVKSDEDEHLEEKTTWKDLLIIGFASVVGISLVVGACLYLPRMEFGDSAELRSLIELSQIFKDGVVSERCGEIIKIPSHQKGIIIIEVESFERCAWIIKSDSEKVKVQYWNEGDGLFGRMVIGELGKGFEEFRCSNLSSNDKLTARTPFVLHFTNHRITDPRGRKFVIKLTPVEDEGTHESQPDTYHLSDMKNGSLPLDATAARNGSILGMLAVFQAQKSNGTAREFACSSTGSNQCCGQVDAYSMVHVSYGESCKKMSKLNEGNGQLRSDDTTVIVLHWSHNAANESQCHLTWATRTFPKLPAGVRNQSLFLS